MLNDPLELPLIKKIPAELKLKEFDFGLPLNFILLEQLSCSSPKSDTPTDGVNVSFAKN